MTVNQINPIMQNPVHKWFYAFAILCQFPIIERLYRLSERDTHHSRLVVCIPPVQKDTDF